MEIEGALVDTGNVIAGGLTVVLVCGFSAIAMAPHCDVVKPKLTAGAEDGLVPSKTKLTSGNGFVCATPEFVPIFGEPGVPLFAFDCAATTTSPETTPVKLTVTAAEPELLAWFDVRTPLLGSSSTIEVISSSWFGATVAVTVSAPPTIPVATQPASVYVLPPGMKLIDWTAEPKELTCVSVMTVVVRTLSRVQL